MKTLIAFVAALLVAPLAEAAENRIQQVMRGSKTKAKRARLIWRPV